MTRVHVGDRSMGVGELSRYLNALKQEGYLLNAIPLDLSNAFSLGVIFGKKY